MPAISRSSAVFRHFRAERGRGAGEAHRRGEGAGLHGRLRCLHRIGSADRHRRKSPPQDAHRLAAARAGKRRPGFVRRWRAGCDSEHEMQQRDQALLVRMQEAVVPRPPQALGQDVLQQQVEEVGTGQRADFGFPALTVAVAEAHPRVRQLNA